MFLLVGSTALLQVAEMLQKVELLIASCNMLLILAMQYAQQSF